MSRLSLLGLFLALSGFFTLMEAQIFCAKSVGEPKQGFTSASQSKSNRKARIVSFTFTRSGGFAGAATRIQGLAKLETNGGTVSAEKAGYQRTINAEEKKQLSDWLNRAALITDSNKPTSNSQPDSFVYSLSIPDGDQTRAVDLSAPENAELKKWVETECARIWDHLLDTLKRPS
jgi:hypothetical protein